ncbi:unnamed protein product [Thelazia callipaeda]|uniref:BZIP domain-containing protein n=1 Tax=Thelazia callipaeda TaxID=103827 RepID=A0A0N5D1D1_THECL|nr:unnamed protein product [Thelazia callipaeda]
MVPRDTFQCDTPRKRMSDGIDKLKDEEYILKRKRNNDAVNRTRQKKRQEEINTLMRVDQLRKENAELERKVEGLQKELSFLKEMFVVYANSNRGKPNTSSNGANEND